jgi:chorismate synthase
MGHLRYLTAGESHGPGLTVVMEGLPLGIPLEVRDINPDLSRRQGGYGRGGRMKIERDQATIRSGVRHGYTLGSPLTLLIENRDWINWQEKMAVEPPDVTVAPVTKPRPGHADLAGMIKYGTDDLRNILERSSARETTARVAAGAVARKLLLELNIQVRSRTARIGSITDEPQLEPTDPAAWPWDAVAGSPVRAITRERSDAMTKEIDAAREEGSTLGGIFEVVAWGVPVGLGSHVHWDRKLDAKLSQAIVSINAVKGVEIGSAFANSAARGHDVHDEIAIDTEHGWTRLSNRAGGLEGGMTNGQPIVVRGALKPISTMRRALRTVDVATLEPTTAHFERSDVCVVPAAGVIGEAMVALVLADAMLDKFGGDNLAETKINVDHFRQSYAVHHQANE